MHAAEAAAVQAVVLVQVNDMNKQPKFFCENCNAEVRHDAVICPHCGRFFASVRCPACGFTGNHNEFKDGCPSCGYALSSDVPKQEYKKAKKIKENKFPIAHAIGYERNVRTDADPLPIWIYGLVLLLFAIIAVMFFLY